MGKHRKWFWISGLYDYKRDILLNGMILSGTHCIRVSMRGIIVRGRLGSMHNSERGTVVSLRIPAWNTSLASLQ